MFKYLKFDRWHLMNIDTGEVFNGRFPPEDLTETFGSVYGTKVALNRRKEIVQFLHGTNDTVSFTAVFFAQHVADPIEGELAVLRRMATRDSLLGRPPRLLFWVGNSHVAIECVLQPVSIRYGKPQVDGSPRLATASITLLEAPKYSLDESSNFETRYHHTRSHDYPEFLAVVEYGLPMLGVEIRRRQPTVDVTHPVNTVIKLPSIEGMRKSTIAPTSIVFKSVTGKKETPQRELLRSMGEALAKPAFSTVG